MKKIIISIVFFAVIILIFNYGFNNINKNIEIEKLENTLNAINRAIILCYSVEGAYPPSIKYLQNHYGIIIDKEAFVVDYDIIGSNVKPTVRVIKKGTEAVN